VTWRHLSHAAHFWISAQLAVSVIVRARFSGSNSAVECQLPKLDVAGSIPVSRSLKSVTSSLPKFSVSQCIPFAFNSRETLRASPPPRAGLFDMKSVIVPNLTGSRQEVTSVAGLIKGDSHLLLRTEATETAFKALPLADF